MEASQLKPQRGRKSNDFFQWRPHGRIEGARPSVRNTVAFRNAMPLDAPPKEIGQVAKRRFHWTGNSAVPSEEYVQGVIAAYDFARKELLGELHEHLAVPPVTAEVAMQRWDWVAQWVKGQPCSLTPKQDFED